MGDLDTKKDHRATIRRDAVEAFAHHALEDLGAAGDLRTWRCRRPDSSMFAFRVVLWPGWIVVAGDIGDTMFQHSDRDGLAWLRGAVKSPDYLLSKVRRASKSFMPGDAKSFVERLASGSGDYDAENRPADPDERAAWERHAARARLRAQNIRDACGDDFDDARTFYDACRDQDVNEPPECQDFDSDHVWALEALRWFIAAHDAQPEPYLIRCVDEVGQQEMALWWRPGRMGYTTSLDEAGRYTRGVEAQARSRSIDFAIPLSKALALSSRVVRAEQCAELAPKAAPVSAP